LWIEEASSRILEVERVMSMPGFYYRITCSSCGETSDSYSAFVFPDLWEPVAELPAWSRLHRSYCRIELKLPSDQQRELRKDHARLLALAESVSSPALTVAIPRMDLGERPQDCRITLTPAPLCPFCGSAVHVEWDKSKDSEPRRRLVVCINNEGHPASLQVRRVYVVIPDAEAATHGLARVIDESGESHLFPQSCFVPVHLSVRAERLMCEES
jgi:hypothetical protein